MNERDIFGVGGFLDSLVQVMGVGADVNDRFLHGRNVNAAQQAEDYTSIAIHMDLANIVKLADFFRSVTGADVKGDLDYLAQLMAHVAISVNQDGPVVTDKRRRSENMSSLTYKVRIEFAVACVISFAQSHGYSINIYDLPRDQISKALLVNDWEQLVRIFGKSLREALTAHLERTFAAASSVSEPVGVNAHRYLSAESYWNLCSVAQQEHWSTADVVMLIEAYLSPPLDPHLAFRRTTVTGSEWRRLYDWIHRKDGHRLWQVMNGSNRR